MDIQKPSLEKAFIKDLNELFIEAGLIDILFQYYDYLFDHSSINFTGTFETIPINVFNLFMSDHMKILLKDDITMKLQFANNTSCYFTMLSKYDCNYTNNNYIKQVIVNINAIIKHHLKLHIIELNAETDERPPQQSRFCGTSTKSEDIQSVNLLILKLETWKPNITNINEFM